MNQNDKNKLEKFGMTHNQLQELRSFLVERIVDNMSTKGNPIKWIKFG